MTYFRRKAQFPGEASSCAGRKTWAEPLLPLSTKDLMCKAWAGVRNRDSLDHSVLPPHGFLANSKDSRPALSGILGPLHPGPTSPTKSPGILHPKAEKRKSSPIFGAGPKMGHKDNPGSSLSSCTIPQPPAGFWATHCSVILILCEHGLSNNARPISQGAGRLEGPGIST